MVSCSGCPHVTLSNTLAIRRNMYLLTQVRPYPWDLVHAATSEGTWIVEPSSMDDRKLDVNVIQLDVRSKTPKERANPIVIYICVVVLIAWLAPNGLDNYRD